jgi:hypothetical protein
VPAQEWEDLLLDLEEYRDREVEGVYTEANEMAQNITEKCIRLLLSTACPGTPHRGHVFGRDRCPLDAHSSTAGS